MDAQNLFRDARVLHVRELKAQLADIRARLARAEDELAAWRAHPALALLAARDAAAGGETLVVDGHNAVYNCASFADRDALACAARAWARARPGRFVWIVFDGPDAHAAAEEGLRVSYTGGTGPHRADRFVVDYLRMRRLAGLAGDVAIATNDKSFAREARLQGARVLTIPELARLFQERENDAHATRPNSPAERPDRSAVRRARRPSEERFSSV